MLDNKNKGAGIAGQLGRELDPSIAEALRSQGVNIYDSHASTPVDEEYEERQTESEIRENNTLDPAKQPLNRLLWAGIPICLFVGVVSFFMFSGSSENQVVNLDPTTTKQRQPEKDEKDKKIEELQNELARKSQQKDMAMVPGSLPTPSITPSATPSASSSPTPKITPSAPVAKATPSPPPKPQIVYRDRLVKPSSLALRSSPPSPQSFIPIVNGQQVQRRERKVRPQREPLVASEKALLDSFKPKPKAAPAVPTGDPLIAGNSAGAHLMATLQFNNSDQSQGGQPLGQSMQVVLEQPLKTRNGPGLERGAVLLFQVSSNSQSGAITATSGDALVNGKLVRIQKGAITIQSPNGEPLIAKSYRPGMDGLAAADRNNAMLSGVSAVGEELTKGSATTVIGNGSTVVSQNNTPNVWGAAARGVFGAWSTDQRQRTQAEATKILAAAPIQILPRDTRLRVTVTFPAPISISR
jgi:hypothetical protein